MHDLPWVRLPTAWIARGDLTNFCAGQASMDIAALKIFIYLAHRAEVVIEQNDLTKFRKRLEARATWSDLAEGAGLSRELVSRGLKKLIGRGLIEQVGTTRKKVYVFRQDVTSGWCKLPHAGLVGNQSSFPYLKAIKNRHDYERDALKLYLYLLSIRPNESDYSDVTDDKISKKTGIALDRILSATNTLNALGLLDSRTPYDQETEDNSFLISAENGLIYRYRISFREQLMRNFKRSER